MQAENKAQIGLLRNGNMNKKQKICMWLGIIAACLSNLVFLFFSIGTTIHFSNFCRWSIWIFGIALITGGLIITLKDKNDSKKN